jgi:NAD(P)-dependent dehydrogenase (short-subunit alcohol dehydrogenase family)
VSAGEVVVVTGGTGALGRAVAAHLLRHGDRVAVPYRTRDGFEKLRHELGDAAGLWGAQADLGDLRSSAAFFAEARRELGPIRGLAALAGAYRGSPTLEAAPEDEWPAMLDANLHTAWVACRCALPHLLEQGGSAVTVSARAVAQGGAGAAAYAVSKAGVEALTRALAGENRERGVRFNAVAPGIIDSPGNRTAMPRADRAGWVAPESIAEVIGFLLSPASLPTTGAVIPVHGSA